MGLIRRRDRRGGSDNVDLEVDEVEVLRDAEESLVAALQESDTAVEAIQDAEVDARDGRDSRRWKIGITGVMLAALGLVVARRRR